MIQSEKMQTYTKLFYVNTLCFSTSPGFVAADKYRDIDWKTCINTLQKKQAEIIRAYRKKDYSRVFELQQNLVRSFAARALAVRKVSSNKEKNTPGIDKIIWKTNEQKSQAIFLLRDLSKYKAKPARRVYVSKTRGSTRLLKIPTMFDRAVLTLWYFALIPIAEETADPQSYGSRPYRGVHDCVTYLKLVCSSNTTTRRFVLNLDIKSFFNLISDNWLLKNIPMDKRILKEFLKAKFLSNNAFEETFKDFPQSAAILSLTIANMMLDGLKNAIDKEFLMTRYVNTFVVFGKTQKDLKLKALPLIQDFFGERGLALKAVKIKVSTIEKGFEFLGFLFKKFLNKNRVKSTKQNFFLIQPSPLKIKNFRTKLSSIVKEHKNKCIAMLIIKLNKKLMQWAEYYRVSTVTKFNLINRHLFVIIWKMLKDRYRKVSQKEIVKRHFTKVGNFKWVFYGLPLSVSDSKQVIDKVTLFQINSVKTKKHSLCAPLNCFDPTNYKYFEKRLIRTLLPNIYTKRIQRKLFVSQKGLCPGCNSSLLDYGHTIEIYNIIPKLKGGSDKFKNLRLMHKECYYQKTHTKNL